MSSFCILLHILHLNNKIAEHIIKISHEYRFLKNYDEKWFQKWKNTIRLTEDFNQLQLNSIVVSHNQSCKFHSLCTHVYKIDFSKKLLFTHIIVS